MKLEPLSVTVKQVLSAIPNSSFTAARNLARTSNVCRPKTCLTARHAECRCSVALFNQWTVIPRKLRRLLVQQSAVVHTRSTCLSVSMRSCFFCLNRDSSWAVTVCLHLGPNRPLVSRLSRSLNGAVSTW